jgi:hypothetical protein
MQGPPSQPQLGAAADAIRDAESFLAHQNSTAAQLDLHVVSAILNAHLTTVAGREALDTLQRDVEAAVHTRTDLDTPTGARDFQRFLVGKLNDIRAVVANADLDDTSKSALMAAWTSLYDASKDNRPASEPAASPPRDDDGLDPLDAEEDPYLDSLLDDEPELVGADMPAQPAPSGMPALMPSAPAMPGIPNFGGEGTPGWGIPGGSPLAGLAPERETEPPAQRRDDDTAAEFDDPGQTPADENSATGDDDQPAKPPAGPTTVTLPGGETVTAASPQLAAAIEAAAGGTPIPDAFGAQGITIPAPGTAVSDPVDPAQVAPGDIGMFTDRHAVALGNSKALLDGQIQHISTVKGPGFLGWEHPPAPQTAAPPANPATTAAPAPTRPAAAATQD